MSLTIPRMTIVRVDEAACCRLSNLLRKRNIPCDQEDATLPQLNRCEIGNFYFFLVAICHQTSPRGLPPLEGYMGGRLLKGWDYLSAKFESAVTEDREWLDPRRWVHVSGKDIRLLFRDDAIGDRLTSTDERGEIVRELGTTMLEMGHASLEELYEISAGRICTGYPNLGELLSRFKAYSDPVQKKSFFLLSIMRNKGIWSYVDDSRLRPPVDYHEVRGHLRLGTVVIDDPSLDNKLKENVAVSATEDQLIRSTVSDAIMRVSELSRLNNPSQLHYLFWNVFRSCCTRENPHCHQCPAACSLPDRYVHLTLDDSNGHSCPFSSVCNSREQSKKYYEHVFETDFY